MTQTKTGWQKVPVFGAGTFSLGSVSFPACVAATPAHTLHLHSSFPRDELAATGKLIKHVKNESIPFDIKKKTYGNRLPLFCRTMSKYRHFCGGMTGSL